MSNILNQRVIFSDDGTLSDISTVVNDFRSNNSVLPIVAAEDKLYIASLLPFNHKWIEIEVANDQTSVISADIWWANDWNAAVDIIDQTATSGNTLAQSGILRFSMDRLNGWDRELDSEDITGLTGTKIHDYYWVRLNFSADLNVATAIKYIGHKFSDDDDLYGEYPDLNNSNLQARFDSATDWSEQTFIAAEKIIRELRSRTLIFERDQILDYELFNEASIHKTAEIIYGALGEDYEDDLKRARGYYKEAMNLKRFNLDMNRDAKASEAERFKTTRFMTR